MNLAENIKTIRETKNLKQIEVANHIWVDKSAYSKIEKGLRALTVDKLHKVAGLFNMTTYEILNYANVVPSEIKLESKPDFEKLNLINQLKEDDKNTVFKIIDTMLTKQKFQTFFEQNLQTVK
jgi:transcriptional regulator with XRE-family HTH domain